MVYSKLSFKDQRGETEKVHEKDRTGFLVSSREEDHLIVSQVGYRYAILLVSCDKTYLRYIYIIRDKILRNINF